MSFLISFLAMSDFDVDEKFEHKGECECGKNVSVLSYTPFGLNEYMETVFVLCSCGKQVSIEIPIN